MQGSILSKTNKLSEYIQRFVDYVNRRCVYIVPSRKVVKLIDLEHVELTQKQDYIRELVDNLPENYRSVIYKGLEQIKQGRVPEQLEKIMFFVNNPGTLFKNVMIVYKLGIYSHVMWSLKKKLSEKYKHSDILYVDLFAGTGLIGIRYSNDKVVLLPGSPLLPLIVQNEQRFRKGKRDRSCPLFDKLILCELDRERATTLRIILVKTLELLGYTDYWSYEIVTISGQDNGKISTSEKRRLEQFLKDEQRRIIIARGIDANELAKCLSEIIRSRDHEYLHEGGYATHALIIIDPSGPTQFNLNSLRHICQVPGDVILLAHEVYWARAWRGAIAKGVDGLKARIEAVGLTEADLVDEKQATMRYLEELKRVLETTEMHILREPRSVIEIPIRTREGKTYYLLYATRRSYVEDSAADKGAGWWVQQIKKFAEIVREVSEFGDRVLAIFRGLDYAPIGKLHSDIRDYLR